MTQVLTHTLEVRTNIYYDQEFAYFNILIRLIVIVDTCNHGHVIQNHVHTCNYELQSDAHTCQRVSHVLKTITCVRSSNVT